MILIAASKKDPAGVNIFENLIEHFPFERDGPVYAHTHCDAVLALIDERTIYADYLEKSYPGTEAIFFITRHVSKEGVPTLTTHTPGNFHTADFGGVVGALCPSNPLAQKIALRTMQKERDEASLTHEVSMEATHHGPITSVPTTFMEIGSHHAQWVDPRAGYVVAKAAHEALSYKEYTAPCALGIGGGHYPQKLSNIMLETEWAIGHIIPKYAFPVEPSLLRQAIDKNGPTDAVIMDWKGTPSRSTYRDELETIGMKVYKTKDF